MPYTSYHITYPYYAPYIIPYPIAIICPIPHTIYPISHIHIMPYISHHIPYAYFVPYIIPYPIIMSHTSCRIPYRASILCPIPHTISHIHVMSCPVRGVQVLPFVLLGLGVDDSFVICNAFGRTDPRKSIPDRMAEGLGTSGQDYKMGEGVGRWYRYILA